MLQITCSCATDECRLHKSPPPEVCCKNVADIYDTRAAKLAVDPEIPFGIHGLWLILDFGDAVRPPIYLP